MDEIALTELFRKLGARGRFGNPQASEAELFPRALFQVDDDDTVIDRLAGLHESVLDTEPSGREMRPRGSP